MTNHHEDMLLRVLDFHCRDFDHGVVAAVCSFTSAGFVEIGHVDDVRDVAPRELGDVRGVPDAADGDALRHRTEIGVP